MLCSLEWLRELTPIDHDVDRVVEALTARGLTVDSVEAAGDDSILEIDIPANRPDCLGHVGVARELAAALSSPTPVPPAGHGGQPGDRPPVTVEIEAPELCSRYTACIVRGVRIGPSTPAAARRLESCGIRSINNVVDASNLVLLESGNPIHFFDLALIQDSVIRVRRAAAGEKLRTLDDVEHELDPSMLVIADGKRAVALAGVMGGAYSEIGEQTRDVLIEVAWFDPHSIRKTSRLVKLKTDASHRFERGVDPEGVTAARDLAIARLIELAGGQLDPKSFVDNHPRPWAPTKLALRPPQLQRLLGYQPETAEIVEALTALQCSPEIAADGSIEISTPSFRVDLECEADLVEEVARHLGYERIPLQMTEMSVPASADTGGEVEERTRDLLSRSGFHEAFGYSMIGAGEDRPFVAEDAREPLTVANPIAESMGQLRRSILPGLLRSLDLNLRRGVRDVRLFEIGRVFLEGSDDSFPDEPLRVGIVWSGAGQPRHWGSPGHEVDLHDMIGVVETLTRNLWPAIALERKAAVGFGLHPGQSACWSTDGGIEVGRCGALHPDLAQHFSQPVFAAEIDLGRFDADRSSAQYRELPRLGTVDRDLSLVVGKDVSYRDIEARLEAVESPAPARFDAIDRYQGPPLPEGQAALTVRATLQPGDRSLTEAQIESYRLALIETLEKHLGLKVRGDDSPA